MRRHLTSTGAALVMISAPLGAQAKPGAAAGAVKGKQVTTPDTQTVTIIRSHDFPGYKGSTLPFAVDSLNLAIRRVAYRHVHGNDDLLVLKPDYRPLTRRGDTAFVSVPDGANGVSGTYVRIELRDGRWVAVKDSVRVTWIR